MDSIHVTIIVTCSLIAILLFFIFIIHQEVLFGRMIKQNEKVMMSCNMRMEELIRQNNELLIHADHRLDKANEMVLTLAHSADLLANSIKEMKDMAVERANLYDKETQALIDNRDDFRNAYNKLLVQFEDQRKILRGLAEEDHRALKELAQRPTMNTTNNNSNI